jgi:hypothetical protein
MANGRTIVATLLGCASLLCGVMAWSLSGQPVQSVVRHAIDGPRQGAPAPRAA